MCGFYGVIGRDPREVKWPGGLSHRGPDSEGEYSSGNIYIKHFRLAILGEEKFAHQPMVSLDNRIILAYNGEIYNYKEIAEYMGDPELSAHGDTRVLAEFLSRYGLERLEMLNGMFAIAMYDIRYKTLTLVRDRFGVKPLYYFHDGGSFFFSSEIKSFKGIAGLSVKSEKVTDYLDLGIYPSGRETFFDNIRQVQASTMVRFSDGDITESRYFDICEETRKLSGTSLYPERYEELLSDSIRLRLRSDVPISLHYSGGTDSTALLLKTKEVWGWDYPIVAYTMAFSEEEVDESSLAAKYCDSIGVETRRVILSPEEVPALAGELAYYEDEPYAGVPVIAYLKLNRQERESGFIVSIEGQGGDETFGGYLYHAYMAMYDLVLSGENKELLDALLKANNTDIVKVKDIATRLIASGFTAHMDLTDFRERSGEPAVMFMDWLRTIQVHDIMVNKIPRTLRFHDRASMACGREIRFPLLDHNVLSYGLALGHEEKFKLGLNKYPLRMIIKRYLKDVYSVPKRSVVTPQTLWFRGKLKKWVFDRVALLKEKKVLPDRYFQRCDEFYSRAREDNSFYIWQLVNLSFFLDGKVIK
ncbi:MAG: asparagine synthase (glutamine-hydrolyzing) [Candidatus Omnitrophica bacterium]|nr:asparagine synthase (glutamine-hydrolyzing) [Candidatus Omnitrophota bacterium]